MKERLTIGLDWDQTISADVDFWFEFIDLAIKHGHKVLIVTCRRGDEEDVQECRHHIAPTYFTAGSSKSWYMEQEGVKIDIWVDDSPESVWQGR